MAYCLLKSHGVLPAEIAWRTAWWNRMAYCLLKSHGVLPAEIAWRTACWNRMAYCLLTSHGVLPAETCFHVSLDSYLFQYWFIYAVEELLQPMLSVLPWRRISNKSVCLMAMFYKRVPQDAEYTPSTLHKVMAFPFRWPESHMSKESWKFIILFQFYYLVDIK